VTLLLCFLGRARFEAPKRNVEVASAAAATTTAKTTRRALSPCLHVCLSYFFFGAVLLA
jgi:hypothetical protein